MDKLLIQLRARYPEFSFRASKQFCWSPETNEILYKDPAASKKSKAPSLDDARPRWSLLHEVGHALLAHQNYKADYELIRLEVAAWEKARQVAKEFAIEIDEDHIQDCLDTYRDWIYQRSICPRCTSKCLQQGDLKHYRCFNCHTVWRVTPSLFARSYRKTKNVPQPLHPVFHIEAQL